MKALEDLDTVRASLIKQDMPELLAKLLKVGGINENGEIDLTKMTPHELLDLEEKGLIKLNTQMRKDLTSIKNGLHDK